MLESVKTALLEAGNWFNARTSKFDACRSWQPAGRCWRTPASNPSMQTRSISRDSNLGRCGWESSMPPDDEFQYYGKLTKWVLRSKARKFKGSMLDRAWTMTSSARERHQSRFVFGNDHQLITCLLVHHARVKHLNVVLAGEWASWCDQFTYYKRNARISFETSPTFKAEKFTKKIGWFRNPYLAYALLVHFCLQKRIEHQQPMTGILGPDSGEGVEQLISDWYDSLSRNVQRTHGTIAILSPESVENALVRQISVQLDGNKFRDETSGKVRTKFKRTGRISRTTGDPSCSVNTEGRSETWSIQ